jgi:hypothetical protein
MLGSNRMSKRRSKIKDAGFLALLLGLGGLHFTPLWGIITGGLFIVIVVLSLFNPSSS